MCDKPRIRKQCQRGVSLVEKKAAHLSPNLSHPWNCIQWYICLIPERTLVFQARWGFSALDPHREEGVCHEAISGAVAAVPSECGSRKEHDHTGFLYWPLGPSSPLFPSLTSVGSRRRRSYDTLKYKLSSSLWKELSPSSESPLIPLCTPENMNKQISMLLHPGLFPNSRNSTLANFIVGPRSGLPKGFHQSLQSLLQSAPSRLFYWEALSSLQLLMTSGTILSCHLGSKGLNQEVKA